MFIGSKNLRYERSLNLKYFLKKIALPKNFTIIFAETVILVHEYFLSLNETKRKHFLLELGSSAILSFQMMLVHWIAIYKSLTVQNTCLSLTKLLTDWKRSEKPNKCCEDLLRMQVQFNYISNLLCIFMLPSFIAHSL